MTEKRKRGRPKNALQYNDAGQVVADILHGVEKGNYDNPNQGITERWEKIAGNSEEAKRKRLRRSVTQDCGHVKIAVNFNIQVVEVDGRPAIKFAIVHQTKDIFHGKAAKK